MGSTTDVRYHFYPHICHTQNALHGFSMNKQALIERPKLRERVLTIFPTHTNIITYVYDQQGLSLSVATERTHDSQE